MNSAFLRWRMLSIILVILSVKFVYHLNMAPLIVSFFSCSNSRFLARYIVFFRLVIAWKLSGYMFVSKASWGNDWISILVNFLILSIDIFILSIMKWEECGVSRFLMILINLNDILRARCSLVVL